MNLRRLAIVAKENNKKLSEYLHIEDDYAAFCMDEVGTYLYHKAGEETIREKIIKQNKGLMAISDKMQKRKK